MKLTFINLQEVNSKAKATIHFSGKLGFNAEASDLMKLDESSAFMVAIDGDKDSFKNIYLKPVSSEEINSVKVQKSGGYFSVPLAGVFNMLEIDYVNFKVIFDIILEKYEDEDIYRLKKRLKEIKRTDKSEQEED
jgi:hypothetical protein